MSGHSFLSPSYPDLKIRISLYLEGLLRSAETCLGELGSHDICNLSKLVQSASKDGDALFSKHLCTLHSRHSIPPGSKTTPYSLNISRTQAETKVFSSHLPEANNIPNESTGWFIQLIESISSDAFGGPPPIRRTYDVICKATQGSDFWWFIRHPLVRSELARLHAFLKDAWHHETCYLASIFIGAFLAIHPFRDGNGRTARILFNLLVNRSCDVESHFYIPLKEYMQLSNFGFEYSMREANITGRWSPLIAYLCRTIILSSELTTRSRSLRISSEQS